ncbi:cadherin-like beta sandwich domain-containing protein [Aquimarina litoralis]|uniref:cadherin-like beta sandwich domain-containing protein n=1 Tax=Aquimarina litoralis TaxID=584605 RepID=UPI001C564937|nr:cadherin-like beta sandwich domain-containing protein [Aquimarina litoralis]MBW1298596.1 hypothetical protein [Aquimarina litoralis]
MKKHQIYLLWFLLVGWYSFAQSPNWQVNENNFQYTMSFVAFLNLDGQDLNDPDDRVAAFVNNECRGVTNLTYVVSENKYYAYLTVFSNNNGETIEFKIYDASNDVVRDIEATETFEINQHYGDLFQAFSIASPQLNSVANLLSFDFVEVSVNDQVFNENQITLYLNENVDRTSLNAVYAVSPGAKLYLNREELTSGSNNLDFTNPISFEVLSEDKSVSKTYTVLVNINSADFKFYKKDAVCYTGGAIKITSVTDGEDVILLKDNEILQSGTLSNGELIFNDLVTGSYTVRVSDNSKVITINQKN